MQTRPARQLTQQQLHISSCKPPTLNLWSRNCCSSACGVHCCAAGHASVRPVMTTGCRGASKSSMKRSEVRSCGQQNNSRAINQKQEHHSQRKASSEVLWATKRQ